MIQLLTAIVEFIKYFFTSHEANKAAEEKKASYDSKKLDQEAERFRLMRRGVRRILGGLSQGSKGTSGNPKA